MRTRVLAVITTYNRPEICSRLMESLTRITSPSFDVFLIENRSAKDYSKVAGKDWGFRVVYRKMDDNYGLPITFNKGIRYAIEKGYEFVWVLDDDTLVEEDTLRYMVEELDREKDVAVTGSAIFNISKRDKLLHAGAFFDFEMLTPIPNEVIDSGISEVDYVADCSSLVRTSLIKEHNILYDENYFFHVEDMDFPLMFKERGYRVTVDPRSRIYHMDWIENYPASSSPIYYDVRNMLYMLMKFRPRQFRRSGLPMITFRRNVYYFLLGSIFTYLSGNIPLAYAFYLSVKDIYDLRMHRSDLNERTGITGANDTARIENKDILVPVEFTEQEKKRFEELVREQTKDCRIHRDHRMTRSGRIKRSITSWRKYDYVFISNIKMNILFPMMGRGIIKMEDNRLQTYELRYKEFLKFTLAVIMLSIRITKRRAFGFKRWRDRLIWRPGVI